MNLADYTSPDLILSPDGIKAILKLANKLEWSVQSVSHNPKARELHLRSLDRTRKISLVEFLHENFPELPAHTKDTGDVYEMGEVINWRCSAQRLILEPIETPDFNSDNCYGLYNLDVISVPGFVIIKQLLASHPDGGFGIDRPRVYPLTRVGDGRFPYVEAPKLVSELEYYGKVYREITTTQYL